MTEADGFAQQGQVERQADALIDGAQGFSIGAMRMTLRSMPPLAAPSTMLIAVQSVCMASWLGALPPPTSSGSSIMAAASMMPAMPTGRCRTTVA